MARFFVIMAVVFCAASLTAQPTVPTITWTSPDSTVTVEVTDPDPADQCVTFRFVGDTSGVGILLGGVDFKAVRVLPARNGAVQIAGWQPGKKLFISVVLPGRAGTYDIGVFIREFPRETRLSRIVIN